MGKKGRPVTLEQLINDANPTSGPHEDLTRLNATLRGIASGELIVESRRQQTRRRLAIGVGCVALSAVAGLVVAHLPTSNSAGSEASSLSGLSGGKPKGIGIDSRATFLVNGTNQLTTIAEFTVDPTVVVNGEGTIDVELVMKVGKAQFMSLYPTTPDDQAQAARIYPTLTPKKYFSVAEQYEANKGVCVTELGALVDQIKAHPDLFDGKYQDQIKSAQNAYKIEPYTAVPDDPAVVNLELYQVGSQPSGSFEALVCPK